MNKTAVEQACETIPGFEQLLQRFKRKMSVSGKAKNTMIIYCRSIAQVSLYFKSLPTKLNADQVEEYLYQVKVKHTSPSETFFKLTVIALRFVFKMEGLEDQRIKLPVLKKIKKLPVVLSRQEMITMLNRPLIVKHRLLIALLYGCGLRCSELRNLKWSDLDFDRCLLHVRQGKGKKDRYLPLGNYLAETFKSYFNSCQPRTYLFGARTGKGPEGKFDKNISNRGIQWAIREAAKKSGIIKPVNVHTLRHTYATHLLEDGLDILSIKELLGHSSIHTTLIYLHVMQPHVKVKFSPIDHLPGVKSILGIQYKIDFKEESL
jgi:site-specific recombinase XerD